MCASLAVSAMSFYILANIEHRICQCLIYWTKLKNSAWYTYGAFLGESITGTSNSDKAWAIRYIQACRDQCALVVVLSVRLFLNFN